MNQVNAKQEEDHTMKDFKRVVVRVKPNRYQPTKAEVEEIFEPPRKADGSEYTVDEAVRTLLRPVKVVKDPKVK